MTEDQAKEVAKQLRKPEGDFGKIVGQKMNESNLNMNVYTIKHLDLIANDAILEIGMGNGHFVKDILNVDATITYAGLDFSQTMIEESIGINQNFIAERRAVFKLGNAELMPFKDRSFNKIFTINTIYFWENPEKVLNEFRRVLQDNGSLTITIRPKHIMDTLPITQYGFTTFGKDDVCNLLIANGFVIENTIDTIEAEEDFFGERLNDTFVIVQAKPL